MSKKFVKDDFVKESLAFGYNRRKKYKSEATFLHAVFQRNKDRITPDFIDFAKRHNLTYFQYFKQLVIENMYDRWDEGGNHYEKKTKTLKESLDEMSRTNYFTDQEMRGKLAWHASLKGNAPDVYSQFQRELQKHWHEKYDIGKWQWEEEQSTWNRQVYSYEKVKFYHGKDGKVYKAEKIKIYVAQTNSPDTFELITNDMLGKESPIDFLRKKYAKRKTEED